MEAFLSVSLTQAASLDPVPRQKAFKKQVREETGSDNNVKIF